jgi:hypothetical protein
MMECTVFIAFIQHEKFIQYPDFAFLARFSASIMHRPIGGNAEPGANFRRHPGLTGQNSGFAL